MNNHHPTSEPAEAISYTVENRQFIVRRIFHDTTTVKDLLISEICQGILQKAPLTTSPKSDKLVQ